MAANSELSAGTSTPSLASPEQKPRTGCVHTQLLHAFLEAAEVVAPDEDVIDDLLADLHEAAVVLQDDDANALEVVVPEQEAGDGDAELEFESEHDPLQPYLLEAEQAWTDEEVKDVLTYLKEYGRAQFLKEYVVTRSIPIPTLLYAFDIVLCKALRSKRPKTLLYFLDIGITRELERREKLPMYNTVDDAVALIKNAQRIIILTGAGISVSCGIPDFRSRDGLYASLAHSGEYLLNDPQEMFDIHYFKENPAVFYKIYPSNFTPSPCHRFIKLIENKGKLLRNYTQNIDTLETRAGVQKVLQCHGSFATASCINCRAQFPGNYIETEIMSHEVPVCKSCPPILPPAKSVKSKKKKKKNASPWENDSEEEPDVPAYPPGIIKPDITFFGEKLSDKFDEALADDRPRVDLLLVIGTSLKVSPVSEILTHLRHSIPQILINKTPVRHVNPDVVLLGNADEVVQHLCRKLGWDLPELPSANGASNLEAVHPRPRKRLSEEVDVREPKRVGNSHVWLFEGAEGGKWVEDLERKSLADSLETSDEQEALLSAGTSQPSKKARTG
ncbi:NAD-dependent histone deacetylase sir2 [Steccherinum ochraceum]|uniref:NAD-dependent histone deacetylase sir2 n=1 Tax=Steccherinum ochraceum TaxID=92696 RepID=A0A4R0RXN1_9APHY|nr:NAD-dependent histone deacetylase sir2 [Steccherinum ochraceum]